MNISAGLLDLAYKYQGVILSKISLVTKFNNLRGGFCKRK